MQTSETVSAKRRITHIIAQWQWELRYHNTNETAG